MGFDRRSFIVQKIGSLDLLVSNVGFYFPPAIKTTQWYFHPLFLNKRGSPKRALPEEKKMDKAGRVPEETVRADVEENYIGRDTPEKNRQRQAGMKRSRKGKWTVEEEDFANKLIQFFQQGLLRLPEGTTLRAYIAERLG